MSNYLKPLTQAQYKCSLKAKYFDFHLAKVQGRHPASLFWSYKHLINAGFKQMHKNINKDAPEKNH